MRVDRGKWRQGSDKEDENKKEEEEDEGAYGSISPIPWDDLAKEDELAGGDASLGRPFPFHAREGEPSEPTEMGHVVPSEPFEQRYGLKWQRANEA